MDSNHRSREATDLQSVVIAAIRYSQQRGDQHTNSAPSFKVKIPPKWEGAASQFLDTRSRYRHTGADSAAPSSARMEKWRADRRVRRLGRPETEMRPWDGAASRHTRPGTGFFSLPGRVIAKARCARPPARYFAASAAVTNSTKLRASSAAPPIRPPSMSFCASNSGALDGFMEPP